MLSKSDVIIIRKARSLLWNIRRYGGVAESTPTVIPTEYKKRGKVRKGGVGHVTKREPGGKPPAQFEAVELVVDLAALITHKDTEVTPEMVEQIIPLYLRLRAIVRI